MGHEQVHVVSGHPGVGQGLLGRVDHDPYGSPEDLFPVHVEVPAVVAGEQVAEGAVGVEVPAEKVAWPVDRFHDHGPRTVAHQHGHLAVVPVGDPTEGVGTDQEDPSRTDAHETGGRHEAVDEARAGGVEVERAAGGTQQCLYRRRRPRDQRVGRGGGQQEHVDVRRVEARPAPGPVGRPRRPDSTSCPRPDARGCPCAQ